MFSITFYTINKRDNSTKLPSNGRAFNCIINKGSGVITPTITLDIGANENPTAYNYCYIPAFNRYYHVGEWYYTEGLWTVTLQVDVLATARNDIGNSTLYVLRSASAYDGNVIDTLYHSKATATYQVTDIGNPLQYYPSDGVFILGITNKVSEYGCVDYYILDQNEFSHFNRVILSNTLLNNAGIDDSYNIGVELQKAIIDPMSFIKSSMYFPLSRSELGLNVAPSTQAIQIFNWNMATVDPDAKGGKLVKKSATNVKYTPTYSKQFTVTLPKHPNASTRGNWLNTTPFTRYTMNVAPFGLIELDSAELINATSVTVKITIDLISGVGYCDIYNGTNLNKRVSTQVGVPIALHQVTTDIWGGAKQVASGAIEATKGIGGMVAGFSAGAAIGSASGNPMVAGATAVGTAISWGGEQTLNGAMTIGDGLITLATPISHTMGNNGGFVDLTLPNKLYTRFAIPVEDDITHNGRPLCQMRRINTLSGYILVQDGDVSTSLTAQENAMIRRYLEGGFYYE